ncbi:flagellar assembly protein FliW [Paenibacillus chitinolyticus]|uniref:Flagellar assembly factor FliW n=1 Tax=Paenibacillus chitinolyticus TaxID=79263 RepID=A0A410WQE6_9BACL|nr:flagellar assembly protein FliW [Paenibacillus chitinolyticus]MCY9591693.1 flagellar assembly protein FliW [Paenibacillus chitinolyticus]MCY9596052.1 flagellar assembly protein FliW [Paenibacillus chitinolyticus]QAV16656.1 flagellar assembly protein FliW [Paenibacillus chitinolyticus]
MIVQSTRFGEIDVSDEQLITFEAGIFGFETNRRYALLQLDNEDPTFHVLQSLSDADLAFVIAEPFLFEPAYEFELPKAISEQLEIKNEGDTQVFGIVSVRAKDNVTMNLKAPIILNKKRNKAAQIILESTNHPIRHSLIKGGA